MYKQIIKFFLVLSLVFCDDLSPIDIIKKSIKRLDGVNMTFNADIKYQSSSTEPINYNLNYSSYWPITDSLLYYNYISFNSPIDYKDVDIWFEYKNDSISVKKRLPVNNEIIDVINNDENSNILSLFNFIDLFEEIKEKSFSLKNKKINNINVYQISAFNPKYKKKSIRLYIDKNDYNLYKVEWTDKRGGIIKKLIFNNWEDINNISFASKIIFEDFKSENKITCLLNSLNFENIDEKNIKKIKSGFDVK